MGLKLLRRETTKKDDPNNRKIRGNREENANLTETKIRDQRETYIATTGEATRN